MYRKVVIPNKENHNFELPWQFFGKWVEVIVIELKENAPVTKARTIPLMGKKVSANELLEAFGTNPDFPSTEDLRAKAWSSEW